MSREHPSLDAQAERFRELRDGIEAKMIRRRAMELIADARSLGLRVEIVNTPNGSPRMGGHHEVCIITPSREGYQSTY